MDRVLNPLIRLRKVINQIMGDIFKNEKKKDTPVETVAEPGIEETQRITFPEIKRPEPIPIIKPKNYAAEENMYYKLRLEAAADQMERYLIADKHGLAVKKCKYKESIINVYF